MRTTKAVMVVAVALLLLAGLPCMESSSSFASNIRTRLLHQFKPPKLEPVVQVNITQEVVVERRRSLMESAVVNIRSVGWRGVAVGGAVVASGLLTSAIVQAARRRLAEQAVSIFSNITEIIDVDPTDRLDSMLRNTALSIQNIDNATSVILVFDSDDSQTSEEKLELKKDSLNLIAAEVAKARSEGEKVEVLFVPRQQSIPHDNSLTFMQWGWKVLDTSDIMYKGVSRSLREKYCASTNDMTVLLIQPGDEQVVASNLVDLMRFVPQYVPWVGRQRPSLSSIITGGDPLLEPSGSNQTVSIFNSSTNHGDIGLFFGAEWSQPCQTFLPLLRTAYETLQAKHKNNSIAKTEIIFVSLDQSEAEFDRYRKEVPFPALPFNDRRRALLQVGMNIRSVPSLVFLSNTSSISTTGVTDVLNDPETNNYPWPTEVINLGKGVSIEKLRHGPVMIAFIENCTSDDQASVKSALSSLHEEIKRSPGIFPQTSRSNILFGYIEKYGELSKLLRKLVQLPAIDSTDASTGSGKPQFAFLDLATENIAATMSSAQGMEISDNVKSESKLLDMLILFVDNFKSYALNTSALLPLESPGATDSVKTEDIDGDSNE